jgi:hypothetical protein
LVEFLGLMAIKPTKPPSPCHYEDGRVLATLLNVALVLVPTELMAVKQTITIRANITAYSTAVGPSSETRKRCTFRASDFIIFLHSSQSLKGDFTGITN